MSQGLIVHRNEMMMSWCWCLCRYGSETDMWKPRMMPPTEKNLQSAWKWVLGLDCEGSRNLLGTVEILSCLISPQSLYQIAKIVILRPANIAYLTYDCEYLLLIIMAKSRDRKLIFWKWYFSLTEAFSLVLSTRVIVWKNGIGYHEMME